MLCPNRNGVGIENMASSSVNFVFRGLIAGVFTPLNKDFSINTELIPKYAKYLSDSGIPGVLVNGTTSEGPALSVTERKTSAEAWASAVKQTKQHLQIQVGGCPLPDVLELARHAEKIGADSILTLPELYFKPTTPQGVIDYLKQIAQAAPNTPLLYYHTPLKTCVNVDMEEVFNLSVGQLPTFHGMKYAAKDLSEAYNALKAANGRHTVMVAPEPLIQPALALGFDTFNTATVNIFPAHVVKIVEAMKENRVEDAREIQRKLTFGVKVITKRGERLPCLKAAMNVLSPINVGPIRPPHKDLTEAQIQEFAINVKEFLL